MQVRGKKILKENILIYYDDDYLEISVFFFNVGMGKASLFKLYVKY